MTPLQFDQIEARRERMDGLDIWVDGDECGDEIRADLDALLDVCRAALSSGPGRFIRAPQSASAKKREGGS